MGCLDIENTGDHPEHPAKANYRYQMTGPIHGGDVDTWHRGELVDVDRDFGYWQHVKQVLNSVDCESQRMEVD